MGFAAIARVTEDRWTQKRRVFGTLCAIDPAPALLKNKKTIAMFKLFAELIAFGSIAAAYVPGQGTTFSIVLPVKIKSLALA